MEKETPTAHAGMQNATYVVEGLSGLHALEKSAAASSMIAILVSCPFASRCRLHVGGLIDTLQVPSALRQITICHVAFRHVVV